MVRSSVLIGSLAALGQMAHGLVFTDKFRQDVKGVSLYLQYDVEGPKALRWGTESDLDITGWKANTEGFPDDQAVVTPVFSEDRTLQCQVGERCELDLSGTRKPFRITRIDEVKPLFTIQDIATSYFLSRTPDLYLELSPVKDDAAIFWFEKFHVEGMNVLFAPTHYFYTNMNISPIASHAEV